MVGEMMAASPLVVSPADEGLSTVLQLMSLQPPGRGALRQRRQWPAEGPGGGRFDSGCGPRPQDLHDLEMPGLARAHGGCF